MAAAYGFYLTFANARISLVSGRNWTVNFYAQKAGQTGALAPISWDYTTTGTEDGVKSQYWNTVELKRMFTVEVYDTAPGTYNTGTLYISSEAWDSMDIGQLWEFWADGNVMGAGQNEWSTKKLLLPLKLVCELDQAAIAEPLTCEY